MRTAINLLPKFMPPKEKTLSNALATKVASPDVPSASIPVFRSTTPEVRITNAVMVQTIMVSANTSKMPHMPCLTGSLTFELE